MEIAFVRHGSTIWNRDRRFQGQTDVPLSDEGRAQAQALARILRPQRFERIVSSDLSRAFDTACAIAGGAHVERDARWREFDFGDWDGLTWEQILVRYPEMADADRTAAKRYAPPGGETFDAVLARVREALDELRSGAHANAIVVTHAGPLHAMLHALFGEVPVRFTPASITRVQLDRDAAQLLALNETSHLD